MYLKAAQLPVCQKLHRSEAEERKKREKDSRFGLQHGSLSGNVPEQQDI